MKQKLTEEELKKYAEQRDRNGVIIFFIFTAVISIPAYFLISFAIGMSK